MESPENIRVRIATPDDVDDVMQLALMCCEENSLRNPSPQKLLSEIWASLNQDHGICAVIGEPGSLEGVILLRIGSLWYTDDPIIEEKAIFIHPDFRAAKGGRARKLCAFSRQAADKLGIPLIIGVLSNTRTEAKVRMYEREFGKAGGAFFIYGAETGQSPMAI